MDQKENDSDEYLDLSKEEIYFEHCSKTADEDEFDLIVSCLEEILFDDSFMKEQSDFFEQHCDIFEDKEENKIEYTEIFEKFKSITENIIEQRLKSTLKGFSMRKFEKMLSLRGDELGGEVFDFLFSLTDFSEFKETMLSHKNKGKGQLDLSISGHHLK